jgi:hypothetical protein
MKNGRGGLMAGLVAMLGLGRATKQTSGAGSGVASVTPRGYGSDQFGFAGKRPLSRHRRKGHRPRKYHGRLRFRPQGASSIRAWRKSVPDAHGFRLARRFGHVHQFRTRAERISEKRFGPPYPWLMQGLIDEAQRLAAERT